MNCDKIRELIPDAASRQLSREEQASVESHLAGCPSCRKDFEGSQALIGGLRRFYGELDTGGKPFSFPNAARPESPAPLWNFGWKIGLVFSVILVAGVLSVFHGIPGPLGKDGILRSGSLLELASNFTIRKDAPLRLNTPFRALEESVIDHHGRTNCTVVMGTNFVLDSEGIGLFSGGGRFQVKPGADRVRVRTMTAVIGVLGTTFDVVVNERLLAVHLLTGKIRIESGSSTFLMSPGDVTVTPPGSATRLIYPSESPWKIFTRDPQAWDKHLLVQLPLPANLQGSPPSSFPLPPLGAPASAGSQVHFPTPDTAPATATGTATATSTEMAAPTEVATETATETATATATAAETGTATATETATSTGTNAVFEPASVPVSVGETKTASSSADPNNPEEVMNGEN